MNQTILKALKERGYETVDNAFYAKIDEWKRWYLSDVPSFHSYKVFNGQENLTLHRYTMGMAKKGCEDWANLLMNEKVSITLEGKEEQDFVDRTLDANNFDVKISEMQELKGAQGTTAYVPRVKGVEVAKATGKTIGNASGIVIDYVTAENIAPLSWENGRVTECAFASDVKFGEHKYVYVQIHKIGNDGNYDIENILYLNDNDFLQEVPLKSVKAFRNVSSVVHTGSPMRQFVIDRMNIVNNFDPTLPMGISIFANCIDNLKACDIAYDAYVNEFILGKKRIMVQPEASKTIDGMPVFDASDTCFYVMPEGVGNNTVIQEINMSLRSSEMNRGMQDMLNVLSAKMGFGENHYRFEHGNVQTATQVISENSTLFRSIKKHEIVLESVLIELCHIILRLGNTYMGAKLNEDVEMSIDFDDSIIEDRNTEFSRDLQMLTSGVLSSYEFRMKWRNEDEQTAKQAIEEVTKQATEMQNQQAQAQQEEAARQEKEQIEMNSQATAEARQFELQKLQMQQQFEMEKLKQTQEFELQKVQLQSQQKSVNTKKETKTGQNGQ